MPTLTRLNERIGRKNGPCNRCERLQLLIKIRSYFMRRGPVGFLRSREKTCAVIFLFALLFLVVDLNNLRSTSRPLVVIVACTKSVETWRTVKDTTLVSRLLPSIDRTITQQERGYFAVELLISFDSGDMFWESSTNRDAALAASALPLTFISIRRMGSPRIPFNEATRAAYEFGASYIVRINDDTEFTSQGWISLAVDELHSFSPPLVGVVGPTCKEGNEAILTHDMVHATHLEIFTDYYPVELNNWWIDDWISSVYGESRTTKLAKWSVSHHTRRHGQRYTVNQTQKELLPLLLERDRGKVRAFIHGKQTGKESVKSLGSGSVDVVAGTRLRHAHDRI